MDFFSAYVYLYNLPITTWLPTPYSFKTPTRTSSPTSTETILSKDPVFIHSPENILRMGNSLGGKKTTKIMKIDGESFKLKTPVKAEEVLQDFPGHVLLDSESVKHYGARAKPLEVAFITFLQLSLLK